MSDFVEVKTTELVGSALDWVTAKCSGMPFFTMGEDWPGNYNVTVMAGETPVLICDLTGRMWREHQGITAPWSPSVDWSQGGPIVEKEKIALQWIGYWDARCDRPRNEGGGSGYARGPTPLIALLRAIITAKLGETVHVPAELVNNSVNNDNT